ncbi:MAG: aspartate-semialdehyde dehydrogenase [Aeromonadaceae bacterium]|nr:aspartate-semialdehyde dehydrogenase [Aeromonadaceae bacterium]
MSQQFDIALLGVDTLGGQTLLELLEERDYPCGRLFPLVSQAGELESVRFAGKTLRVQEAADFDWSQVQLAFFMAGSAATARWAEQAAEAGCLVIDNSQHYRTDPSVPLVIPEVNGDALAEARARHIVASPTCIVTQLMMALKPLHDEAGIARINLVSLQSVSGTGQAGVDELARQTAQLLNGRPVEPSAYAAQIAFNLLPCVDEVQEDGFTLEEWRLAEETRRLLEDDSIGVNATCVRVPVFFGHSQVVHLETRYPVSLTEVRHCLAQMPGLTLVDDELVTPVTHGVNDTQVYLSRLRQDPSHPQGLDFWLVTDNVRKGGALNCLQLAEAWIQPQH